MNAVLCVCMCAYVYAVCGMSVVCLLYLCGFLMFVFVGVCVVNVFICFCTPSVATHSGFL